MLGFATVATTIVATLAIGGKQNGQRFDWLNWKLGEEERAVALVKSLSLEEKCSQLITDSRAIENLGVPAYHWRNNVLHGPVDNGVSTMFPQVIGLAASWNEELIEESANVWGHEQRAIYNANLHVTRFGLPQTTMNNGLNLWGPNINMFVHPYWGRGQETFGEDPYLTGRLAAAVVRSLQQKKDGILMSIATPKHFDAYIVDRDPPRLNFTEGIKEGILMQYYLPAFKRVVQAGAESIMCSYNGIGTVYRGEKVSSPMCMSPLLEIVLRDEFKFKGFIVSDSGAIDFMRSRFHRFSTLSEAAAAGISAGCDLNSGWVYNASLCDAVYNGKVPEKLLDVSLRRLFKARIRLGLFDPVERDPFSNISSKILNSQEHRRIALDAARSSIVLLKNGNEVLPLHPSRQKFKRFGFIGPAANDTFRMVGNYYGCSFGTWGALLPQCQIKPAMEELMKELSLYGDVHFAAGCEQESDDTSGFDDALQVTEKSDIVFMFLGLRNCRPEDSPNNCESEGKDRNHLRLPGRQSDLLKAVAKMGKPIVLILSTGGPLIITEEIELADAALVAWYGGSLGSRAIADIVLGYATPSGRLPLTFPATESQVANRFGTSLIDEPGRTYQFLSSTPLFSFGFGLSYARFIYDSARLSESIWNRHAKRPVKVCVTIKCIYPPYMNNQPQQEVVMAFATYLGHQNIPYRPKKYLVGFHLARNVTSSAKEYCLELDTDALKLYTGPQTMEVPIGLFRISIGGQPPEGSSKPPIPEILQKPTDLLLQVVDGESSPQIETSVW